jgi:glycerol-3-phosphate O-acyltransferase
MRPLVSHVIVRPFVEAYRLVADVLAQDETLARDETPASRDEVTRQALGLGRQYVAQGRLRSAEPVSVLLFQTAFQLAGNQGLLAAGADVAARRAAFWGELRGLVRRLGRIEELAVRRYLTGA